MGLWLNFLPLTSSRDTVAATRIIGITKNGNTGITLHRVAVGVAETLTSKPLY
jgi:hypothetical protein